jgi:hypothetical protein
MEQAASFAASETEVVPPADRAVIDRTGNMTGKQEWQ